MKTVNCQFIGSFYKLDQLPKDRKPQVAFAGRSNVGKSTLLNKLIGHKKMAKVSSTPGKTRSLNFFLINEKYYFVDLPGYGFAKGPIEERDNWKKLIESYFLENENLKGIILLLDCRREPNNDDKQLINWMAETGKPGIIVVTKADKLNKDKLNRKVREFEKMFSLAAIPFSALSGIGKDQIFAAIQHLFEENN